VSYHQREHTLAHVEPRACRAVGPGLPESCTWLDAARELLEPRPYAAAWGTGEALTPLEAITAGNLFEQSQYRQCSRW
jgi:hypothetical protein